MHTTKATTKDGREVLAVHNSDHSGMTDVREFDKEGNLVAHIMIRGESLRALALAIARKEVAIAIEDALEKL